MKTTTLQTGFGFGRVIRSAPALLVALPLAAQSAPETPVIFQQLVPLPQGTKLDVEIHWDNSAENPRNPSGPPVRVTWGEESKDELGSISLMAVQHEESDLGTLQGDLSRRSRQLAKDRMQSDPALARKVAQILAE